MVLNYWLLSMLSYEKIGFTFHKSLYCRWKSNELLFVLWTSRSPALSGHHGRLLSQVQKDQIQNMTQTLSKKIHKQIT
jgi:hypothetical protein